MLLQEIYTHLLHISQHVALGLLTTVSAQMLQGNFILTFLRWSKKCNYLLLKWYCWNYSPLGNFKSRWEILLDFIYWFRKWKKCSFFNLFYNFLWQTVWTSASAGFQMLNIIGYFLRWGWLCKQGIWVRTSEIIWVVSVRYILFCSFFPINVKQSLEFSAILSLSVYSSYKWLSCSLLIYYTEFEHFLKAMGKTILDTISWI